MRRPRYREFKVGRFTLIDAKTGPRHVLTGEVARMLPENLGGSAFEQGFFDGQVWSTNDSERPSWSEKPL